ncbi:hypothetical protein RB595_005947 [Gaeumannomyces hyphopodioides]
MSAEHKLESWKQRREELLERRRADPPAPSATPPTDVQLSDHENAEYVSKPSHIVARESWAPPSPPTAAAKAARPDTDAGAPDHHQSPTRSGEHIPVVSEFLALVVDEVNEKGLFHGVGAGCVGRATANSRLPVRLVKLPVDDGSKVAVLSWRWDGDLEVHGSKNIASAIHQAKKMGIRYLFVDIVSIDQCLPGDALMEQVVAFSSLYKTIPVIAAYDKDGEDFERAIYRPWVFNEVRLFRYNPTKIVYVGHNDQGTAYRHGRRPPGWEPILGVKLYLYEFGMELGQI